MIPGTNANRKKKLTLLSYTVAAAVIIAAGAVIAWKLQVDSERDWVLLICNLAALGDEASKEQNFVKANEYYSHALEYSKNIKLWAENKQLAATLRQILNSPPMRKTREGYVLYKGKWIERGRYIDERSGHARILQETREQVEQAEALFANHNYHEAANEFYSVLQRLQIEKWLPARLGDVKQIMDMAASFPDGKTSPMHLAASDDADCSTAIILQLIEHNGNINAVDSNGETPLLLAIQAVNAEMANLLLSHGATPDLKNAAGNAPLHVAVPDPELVKILLKYDAELDITDDDGNTPLHLAVKDNAVDVVRMLLEGGAKTDIRNRWGRTPLHEAIRYPQIVRILLANGAAPSPKDARGLTPLHLAARDGSAKTVNMLLAAGARINIRDRAGRTPLYLAVKRPVIARILLKRGANPNTRNVSGITPFILSVNSCNARVVKDMLAHGAYATAKDSSGLSMPIIAYRCKNRDAIIGMLLQQGAETKGLERILKRELVSKARARARAEIDRINQKVQAILDREYSNLLSRISARAKSQLNELVYTTSAWFTPLKADGSNVRKVLQSSITAFNDIARHYGSFTLDETLNGLLGSLNNIVNRYRAGYLLKAYYGRKSLEVRAVPVAGGPSLETHRLTDGTPFVFRDRNYLVMKQLTDLPGLEDVLTTRMLNKIVQEEITRYRNDGR